MGHRRIIRKEHHKNSAKNIKEKRRIKKAKKERRQYLNDLIFHKS